VPRLFHKGFEHHTPWSIASFIVLTNPNWLFETKQLTKQKQTFNMKFFAAVAALSLGGVEGKKKKKK
jgi:hypothetical protein